MESNSEGKTPLSPQNSLSERELLIAQRAAEIAMQRLSDEFYKQVGKTFVQKVLIFLGAIIVGWALARGWVTLDLPLGK